ncbi:MAG TPA: ABC transporter permease [Agriterribacter sp.]|nr:ABC transporter permease [Agriterribacter sp.]
MIRNYFTTALRSFRKNKIFSFINVFGLAFGLACFILIAIFVLDELNYDTYPKDAKDIYRVSVSVTGNGDVAVYPNVDWAVGEGMKRAFPEITSFARLSTASDFVQYNDKQFKEDKLAFADPNFLQMFSIPLTEGSEKDALVQPNSIVISKAFAKKYFGENKAAGKSVNIGLHGAVYKVTGVFDKVPENSHFHFDAFISLSTFNITNPTWSNIGLFTYVKLNKSADPAKLEKKFPQLVEKYVVPEVQHDMGISYAEARKSINTFIFTLQPITKIHLYAHTRYELEPGGDIQYVYIFSALAVFILLLACINFTNLSIARSVKRAKEVGVRKVLGSERFQLIKQFLSESVLMSIFALLLAIGIILLILPYFNELSGKEISAAYFLQYKFLISVLALVVFVGIIAGVYPSFFLSSFNPVKVLKVSPVKSGQKNMLRSGLIVFQFFVSTTLIMSTMVVYQQLSYLQNKKLGYDKEQVLFLPDARLMGERQNAFKQEVLKDSRVVSATIARSIPGSDFMDGTQVHPENENGNGTEIHMNIYHVDYDYVKTLGMQIEKGRYFSKEYGSDSDGVVINATAVRELGWSKLDPVGKTIIGSGQHRYKVVGVVADFNYASAKQKIAPLMMMLGRNYGGLVIKIKTDNVSSLLHNLKTTWNTFNPQGPFSYIFLDDKFASLYAGEIKTQQIFTAFAVIAVIIAGLGLFGLSAFVIEQRTKEIGIRKVLGASVQQVLFLVSKQFLLFVLIAFVISVPVTYWGMSTWLESYAYRIHISAFVFLAAGLIAVLIALTTISFQSIKAAIANPVKSLRTE